MTAVRSGKKRAGAGAVLADLMLILTALFFDALDVAWIKRTWFFVSCAAFLGVSYVIWMSLIVVHSVNGLQKPITLREIRSALAARCPV